MSGYLKFQHTGVGSIDSILQAIEDAGDAYYHTMSWNELVDPNDASLGTYLTNIQDAAQTAAEKFLNMQMLLDK